MPANQLTATLNRPEGVLYGCRFGCFIDDNYNESVYVDDYDIGETPKMIYVFDKCMMEDYTIDYDGNTTITTSICKEGNPPVFDTSISLKCYVLFNSNTIPSITISPKVNGSAPTQNVQKIEYNILDGKIINTDGSIDNENTELYKNILRDSDNSRYLHNKMVMCIVSIPTKELTTATFTINPQFRINTLSLKFKELDGNTMKVSDIISNDENPNLIIESDRYKDGYYLNLDSSTTFKYNSGDPDRYVPKFNLKWKVPVVIGDYYTSTNSYFGAFVKDTGGKFICISQPNIQFMGSMPIEYVTFPIELYPSEDLYYKENGDIPIYLVRFKGISIEQDIFKTNMINSVTDFIKTY